ncbi:T9SS type A sorting domain-containing protein [uncultured Draconibacterium sp.]|uniref:T9SS type A sorting domain-containing protein n=1 Tax=uncultured Draconibacterium sp. TaxID=1573823 RepID=UPI0025D6DB38|nr:T9SS type A sorting domain-containing protein [uncultured Draconibacterium sp.]
MLKIRGEFVDGNEFSNLYLNIIKENPEPVRTIDFDEAYGIRSGQSLVAKINEALASLNAGDTLLFNRPEYDFEGNSLNISKGICLSGALPDVAATDSIGAYKVTTTFKNMKNFHVRTSNINLTNMRFIPVDSIGYVFTRFSNSTAGQFYTGILINNVIFENGNLQCYGENGAGITFRNVSFLNFAHGGYNCNRKEPIDGLPQSIVKRCKFVPNWDEVFYNTRGVSMDAGNDNHPVVWDMNGMHIDSCLFDGTGCGWSKGKNAKVTNCHFIGYRGDVDMIHMEEYTNNILVENNLFEYSKPSRTFYQDRSLQPCSDITIINNTFKGKYKWIFWGESPQNMRFEGNDMTEASANNPDEYTFDFTAHQTGAYESAPFDLPIGGLVIRNNAGIAKESMGVMRLHELANETGNIIEAYPAAKIQKNVVQQRPFSLIDTSAVYRIINNNSGEAMLAAEGTINVQLSSAAVSDSADLWKVNFEYPYNYTFLNLKTKQYMEIFKIYTLGDYGDEDLPIYYVEQKSNWADKTALPHWFLSTVEGSDSGLFQIYPGTNEKKSRVIKNGHDVVLGLAQTVGVKGFEPPSEASTWRFEPVFPVGISEPQNLPELKCYPNPAQEFLQLSFSSAIKNDTTIEFYNLNGICLKSLILDSGTVDETIHLNGFLPGVYLLRASSENRSSTLKLLVER